MTLVRLERRGAVFVLTLAVRGRARVGGRRWARWIPRLTADRSVGAARRSDADRPRGARVFLQNGENRFNPAFVAAINAALDTVEAADGAAALVTVGEGKFFSNGLDLDWILGSGEAGMRFVAVDFLGMLRRVLALPVPTVAALNGHTFAGGCLLAMAHDYRFMRKDRGYICMNEIELPMPLSPAMAALLRCATGPSRQPGQACGMRADGPGPAGWW